MKTSPEAAICPTPADREITDLLSAWHDGDPGALDDLIVRLYRDLKRLAQSYVGRERRTPTLQATDLVHEAFLRIEGLDAVAWRDRRHFFVVAARMMRRILIDAARRRTMKRRHGEVTTAVVDRAPSEAAEILAVDDALDELSRHRPELARVVELRFFLGLDQAETAAALGVSVRTVKRRWQSAREWLHRHLADGAAS